MLNDFKPTHDPNQDTFKVEYLIGASAVLGILFPYKYTIVESLWAFSIWLESVAILPQLFMLQRTGEAETITTHYLFALGIYRALYIPNWLYRYFIEVPSFFDPIAVVAGIIQTVLYSDFFWIYYTKYVFSILLSSERFTNQLSYQSSARQEVQPPSMSNDISPTLIDRGFWNEESGASGTYFNSCAIDFGEIKSACMNFGRIGSGTKVGCADWVGLHLQVLGYHVGVL
jgi:hypothetical protein